MNELKIFCTGGWFERIVFSIKIIFEENEIYVIEIILLGTVDFSEKT